MASANKKSKNLKDFMTDDEHENMKLTIAVFGKTGVGKSTWINAFVNCLLYESFDEAFENEKLYVPVFTKFLHGETEGNDSDHDYSDGELDETDFQKYFTIAVGDPGELYDQDRSEVESSTRYPCSYTLKNENKMEVTIIDTPGLGDTHDIEDDSHIKMILDHLSMYEIINAFVILLRPDEHRVSQEFLYTIRKIFNQLHKSARLNVVFAFTHGRNTNFENGDTVNVLKKSLQRMELDIEIKNRNTFYFDNSPFRYLAICAKSHVPKNEHRSVMQDFWKKSSKSFLRLLKYVKSLEPHNTSSTISIQEVRLNINIMTEPLLEICKSIKKTSYSIFEAIAAVNQSLETQGKTKVVSAKGQELVYKPLAAPQTVCSNQKCCKQEIFTEEDGRKTTKQIYDPICCKGCWLPIVPVERKGAIQLIFCWSLKSRTCNKCGHHLNEHMHITYELEQIDKIIQGSTDSLQQELSEQETEYNDISAACGLFMYYLKQNELTKMCDSITSDLEEAINREKLHGHDEEKISLLHELQSRFQMEYDCLSGTQVPTPAEIQERMQSLFQLKHNGQKLKTIYDGIKDSYCRFHSKNRHVHRRYSLSGHEEREDWLALPSVQFNEKSDFEIEKPGKEGASRIPLLDRIWARKT